MWELATNPIRDSTQTAQVVKPYTKANGKYVATEQQHCSHLLTHFLGRRLEGPGEVDEERERDIALLSIPRELL